MPKKNFKQDKKCKYKYGEIVDLIKLTSFWWVKVMFGLMKQTACLAQRQK